MHIFYVTNRKPLSHNKSASHEKYKQLFRDEFNKKYAKLYNNLPIEKGPLQSCVVYVHQLRPGVIPDVDNLSKPIVDSFSGVIYKDDRLIIKRSAIILELKEFDFVTIDATNMPPEVYNDFNEYHENKEENIVLFEVAEISLDTIRIGEF